MNDLLGDAKAEDDTPTNERERDLEAGPSGAPEAGQDMSSFFQEVNDIKSSMAEIGKRFKKLQESNEESRTVTRAASMKALKEKMEKDIDDISKIAQGVKGKVESLDRANVANRKNKGCHEGSSTDRTRMAITSTLKKKLKELMVDFQALRQRFQDEYREVVERRVFTVTGQKVDDAVIEHLIDTGDSEQIFQKAIQEQGRGQILDTIAEIQERHDAVRDIEKKLVELHQIFLDMAVLVEAQGELLDNIETQTVAGHLSKDCIHQYQLYPVRVAASNRNPVLFADVSKAVEHVASGTQALQKAKTLQRGTRKCMCIAIILLLLVAIIIVVAVIQPWKKTVK